VRDRPKPLSHKYERGFLYFKSQILIVKPTSSLESYSMFPVDFALECEHAPPMLDRYPIWGINDRD